MVIKRGTHACPIHVKTTVSVRCRGRDLNVLAPSGGKVKDVKVRLTLSISSGQPRKPFVLELTSVSTYTANCTLRYCELSHLLLTSLS